MYHSRFIQDDRRTGVAHVAADGRFLSADRQVAQLLGREVEEMRQLRFQDVTHPDDLARDEAQLERLLSQGHGNYSMLKRYLHRSGKPVWTELNVTLNREAAPQPPVFLKRIRRAPVCPDALEDVHNKAYRDAVTGLANRHVLEEQLVAAMRRSQRTGRSFVLVLLDLDGFKLINDTHGHQAGDILLGKVSKRLHRALRQGDFAARMGGDEFALLLFGIEEERDLRARIAAIRQGLIPPYRLDHGPLRMTASLGWALFPQEAATIADLMQQADFAMYRAKRALFSEQSRPPPLLSCRS